MGRQEHVPESELLILSLLSNQLHEELEHAVFVPHLSVHPLFNHINAVSDVTMYRLCNKAMTRIPLARGDTLFFQGEMGDQMYFVLSGELAYLQEAAVFGNDSSQVVEDAEGVETSVHKEDWMCEPVLWTLWPHQGDLHALRECQLLAVAADLFGQVMRMNPSIWRMSSKYAERFVLRMNGFRHSGALTDLALGEEEYRALRSFIDNYLGGKLQRSARAVTTELGWSPQLGARSTGSSNHGAHEQRLSQERHSVEHNTQNLV